MSKLIFSSYDVKIPYLEQKSNVAFMLLQQALLNTDVKPEEPKRAAAWVAMNNLMMGFAALESEVVETVPTQEGPRQVRIVILKAEGGSFDVDAYALELLTKIWEAHKMRHLNLSQARQVMIVDQFLALAKSEVTNSLTE